MGKIVQLPPLLLPGIGIATTAGTGNPISGSKSEIWLCPTYDAEGKGAPLYVKKGLTARAIMVEILCSQIAQVLALPVPQPYIVTAKSKHVGGKGNSNVVCFGTLDMGSQSLARPIKCLNQILTLIQKLKIEDMIATYDEWIANDVRSPNDILFSPDNLLYLIDHESAIPSNKSADEQLTNWLADRLLEGMNNQERRSLLKQMHSRIAAFQRIEFTSAPFSSGFIQGSGELYLELTKFLTERLTHIHRLVSQRIFPNQLHLNLTITQIDGAEQA